MTVQALRDWLIYPTTLGHNGCDERTLVLDELIRRERENASLFAALTVGQQVRDTDAQCFQCGGRPFACACHTKT